MLLYSHHSVECTKGHTWLQSSNAFNAKLPSVFVDVIYSMQVRILGMDLSKGVLDVTMDTDLVKVSIECLTYSIKSIIQMISRFQSPCSPIRSNPV